MTLENPKHEIFCRLVAHGKSQTDAARDAGYSTIRAKATACDLYRRTDIRDRIRELTAELRAGGVPTPIDVAVEANLRDRDKRVAQLQNRYDRMRRVIQERSEDPGMAGVPGGTTGLMCRQLKSIGVGRDNRITSDYTVDVGLLKELRAHEKQAAKELGQWSERKEFSVKRTWADFTTEELRALIQESEDKLQPALDITGEAVQ